VKYTIIGIIIAWHVVSGGAVGGAAAVSRNAVHAGGSFSSVCFGYFADLLARDQKA
jgi:hypothetical protein